MHYIEYFLIPIFGILLFFSIVLLTIIYICDGESCKPYRNSKNKYQPGTKEYILNLIYETHNDGIWIFGFIGASIITPLVLWIFCDFFTTKYFLFVFLISFITIYGLFSFYGHHYLNVILYSIEEYISKNCLVNEINKPKINEIDKIDRINEITIINDNPNIEFYSNNFQ